MYISKVFEQRVFIRHAAHRRLMQAERNGRFDELRGDRVDARRIFDARFPRNRNFLCFEFFPIDRIEKRLSFDFFDVFGPTAETLTRRFNQQLKPNGKKIIEFDQFYNDERTCSIKDFARSEMLAIKRTDRRWMLSYISGTSRE